MENGLLFNQTGPIRALTPGLADNAERLNSPQGLFISHGPQLPLANGLKQCAFLALVFEPLLFVKTFVHADIILWRDRVGSLPIVHNLTLATRNIRHFPMLQKAIIDPWQAE